MIIITLISGTLSSKHKGISRPEVGLPSHQVAIFWSPSWVPSQGSRPSSGREDERSHVFSGIMHVYSTKDCMGVHMSNYISIYL